MAIKVGKKLRWVHFRLFQQNRPKAEVQKRRPKAGVGRCYPGAGVRKVSRRDDRGHAHRTQGTLLSDLMAKATLAARIIPPRPSATARGGLLVVKAALKSALLSEFTVVFPLERVAANRPAATPPRP